MESNRSSPPGRFKTQGFNKVLYSGITMVSEAQRVIKLMTYDTTYLYICYKMLFWWFSTASAGMSAKDINLLGAYLLEPSKVSMAVVTFWFK